MYMNVVKIYPSVCCESYLESQSSCKKKFESWVGAVVNFLMQCLMCLKLNATNTD